MLHSNYVMAVWQEYGTVTVKDCAETTAVSMVVEYANPNDAKVASIHGERLLLLHISPPFYILGVWHCQSSAEVPSRCLPSIN